MGVTSFEDLKQQLKDSNPEMERYMSTYYQESVDYFKQEGRAEGHELGLQQGLKQGRSEGKSEGLLAALLLVLEQKFGELDHADLRRLQAGTEEELARWTKAVIPAGKLEDVFDFRSPEDEVSG